MSNQNLASVKPASFLGLPSHIREQIYRETHIRSNQILSLSKRSKRTIWEGWLKRVWWHDVGEFDLNLMQVCRTTRLEITRILFAENTIMVCSDSVRAGLRVLHELPPEVVSGLTNLTIEVYREPSADREFEPPEPLTVTNIELWQSTIARILSLVPPKQLWLRLTCDYGQTRETEAVLKPLLHRPGVLQGLELRLYDKGVRQVRAIANEAAKAILADSSEVKSWRDLLWPTMKPLVQPFRYLDLPVHIRLQILEYTDLVTPRCRVDWRRDLGFNNLEDYYDRNCYSTDTCEYTHCYRIHSGPSDPNCSHASHTLDPYICRKRHSAFSTRCRCWRSPLPLFLVNKAMMRDAVSVFYSKNALNVYCLPSLFAGLAKWHTNRRLCASSFITRNMEPHVLGHLRRLNISFPPLKTCFQPEESDPIGCDWRFAIHHLSTYANVPKLTLTINIVLQVPDRNRGESFSTWEGIIGRTLIELGHDAPSRLKVHATLFRPLQALQGMGAFFVHIDRPAFWPIGNREPYGTRIAEADFQINEMEQWLERLVMGQGYDSSAFGKERRLV